MPVRHLPKGTEITYECVVEKRDRKRDVINFFKKDGVTGEWVKKDGKRMLVVKGFVAGDTRRKGISVVALDNPESCLISFKDHTAEVRQLLRRGVVNSEELDEVIAGQLNFGSPTCQFSGD